MTTARLVAKKQHFLTILARYARAKMEIEGLTLHQLADIIGASGKNWVFRLLAHDKKPESCGGHIDDPLMNLIDWIGFAEGLVCGGAEPGREEDTYWGDIHGAILNCTDIPEQSRRRLWELVQVWWRTVDDYETRLCSCGEAHYCESEVRDLSPPSDPPMTASEVIARMEKRSMR